MAAAVIGRRRLGILSQLTSGAEGEVTAARLCEVCRDVTGMTGAGIMLMSGDLSLGSVCTTDAASALIEDLQYMLGEGPCVDAYHSNRPVLEPDLAQPKAVRWPAFTGAAVDAGVRAIFGFPMTLGTVRMGALNLYTDRPGPLTDDQHAGALAVAEIAAEAVLVMQAGGSGTVLATELEQASNFQYVVHQAAGMVSAQMDVSVAQALVRLRAHAFAHDRPVAALAADIVARRLRFPAGD
ncbi:MAG: hypothetical protein QOE93_2041 [Actinomycetota bacterium]|jgi:hypothetical protein|nr:hypothetical protein [Actinomycetota bacterium]